MPSVDELVRDLQAERKRNVDLEKLLKERIGRIDQIKVELDGITKQLDDYKDAAERNVIDVGEVALHELQSLCELDGPFVALAYAETVFTQLAGLVDPEESLTADRLVGLNSDVAEYRNRSTRFEARVQRRRVAS